MTTEKIPIWLDCDPGHDDVFAILLAAYHPRIELLGISSVFGNAPVENTTRNAASVLTAIAKHDSIPLHAGHAGALSRPLTIYAPAIHGASGLDGTALLPAPLAAPSPVPAVEAMAAALEAQPPGKAWIVATGALTNVAALLRARPELAARLAGLSIMGGVLGGEFSDAPLGAAAVGMGEEGGEGRTTEGIGNISPWAEFNMLVDPEAAALVLGNEGTRGRTTLVTLDLTHQVLATKEVRERLLYGEAGKDGQGGGKGKTTLRTMLVELLDFFSQTYADVFGITDGPPLHDPLAVAAVLDACSDHDNDNDGDSIPFDDWDARRSTHPRYGERFAVRVVTDGTLDDARNGKAETGRTVASLLGRGEEGVRIPRSVDVGRFWDVVCGCVARADEANAARGWV